MAISAGITPSESVKVKHYFLASEKWTITWKRCKIGGQLLLITNRKLHELSIGTKIGDLE